MASSVVLKRSSNIVLNKLLHPLRPSAVAAPPPVSRRSFNTSAQISDSEDDDRDLDVQRRRLVASPPYFFADVFDPLSPTRSLGQVLNQFLDSPLNTAATRGGLGGSPRRGWDAKEDNDAFHLRVDMPGLGKEDVKVFMEQDTLVITGEGEKEGDDEESVRRYNSRIDLPPRIFRLDGIKAEMKNGVLKVLVPKVKKEERKDVREVKVE